MEEENKREVQKEINRERREEHKKTLRHVTS